MTSRHEALLDLVRLLAKVYVDSLFEEEAQARKAAQESARLLAPDAHDVELPGVRGRTARAGRAAKR